MTSTKTNKKTGVSKAAESLPPWKRENPNAPAEHHHLTAAAKASAKRRAHAAGRPYPNLVDNMRAAAESKK